MTQENDTIIARRSEAFKVISSRYSYDQINKALDILMDLADEMRERGILYDFEKLNSAFDIVAEAQKV